MPTYTNYPIPFVLALDQVKDKIKKAIKALFKFDSYLITNDLHEASITHRLAIYLDEIFSNYNVDCEWNKNLNKPKTINFEELTLNFFSEEINRLILLRINNIKKEIRDERDKQLQFISLTKKGEEFLEKKEQHILQLVAEQESINLGWSQGDLEYTDFSGSKFYKLPMKNDFGESVLKKVRPDIIIHHRGTKQNVVVLEIKKKNAGGKNYYEKSMRDDLLKLLVMTTQQDLKYKYGFFIELPEKNFVWKKIQISNSKYLVDCFGDDAKKIFKITFL